MKLTKSPEEIRRLVLTESCTNLIEPLFQLERDSLLIYVSDNKRDAHYMTFITIDQFHVARNQVCGKDKLTPHNFHIAWAHSFLVLFTALPLNTKSTQPLWDLAISHPYSRTEARGLLAPLFQTFSVSLNTSDRGLASVPPTNILGLFWKDLATKASEC